MQVQKASPSIGAEIHGIDVGKDLSSEMISQLLHLLHEHQVLFFRDQTLSPEELLHFAQMWGTPVSYPFIKALEGFPQITPIIKHESEKHNFGGIWHSDTTYQEIPPMGSLLYALEVPDIGGDTMFANQYLAYETLSPGMKSFLMGLQAQNISGKDTVQKTRSDIFKHAAVGLKGDELTAIHPVVRTHPYTKRKSLYVNTAHTTHFIGMTEEESRPILKFLFDHQTKEEFTCRFRWQKGSLAIWDNRCTMHYPLNDYHGSKRHMLRVTFEGEKPV